MYLEEINLHEDACPEDKIQCKGDCKLWVKRKNLRSPHNCINYLLGKLKRKDEIIRRLEDKEKFEECEEERKEGEVDPVTRVGQAFTALKSVMVATELFKHVKMRGPLELATHEYLRSKVVNRYLFMEKVALNIGYQEFGFI